MIDQQGGKSGLDEADERIVRIIREIAQTFNLAADTRWKPAAALAAAFTAGAAVVGAIAAILALILRH